MKSKVNLPIKDASLFENVAKIDVRIEKIRI